MFSAKSRSFFVRWWARWALLALVLVLAVPTAAPAVDDPAQSESRQVSAIFEEASPAVVAITCHKGTNEQYFGTGTIIDPRGIVVTSVSVIPKDAQHIRVYLRGGRVLPARSLLVVPEKEMALAEIEVKGDKPFPYVKLGDSSNVQIGELALTLGNSFQSIQTDDQVSLGEGVVSGFYELTELMPQSTYLGPAIETSAPLNSGADGGPLLDSKGKLIGVLSLNYSRSRWLGTAVPVDQLKPLIKPFLGWFDDADEGLPAAVGIALEETRGGLIVLRVEAGGPAALAGLIPGDRIVSIRGEHVDSVKKFREEYAKAKPGETLRLESSMDGSIRSLELELWGRF